MEKILIIDDDPVLCRIFEKLSLSMGIECISAHTLKKGLAFWETGGWDAVFLDVLLPDGNGLDLLPRLKDEPNGPEIIVITAATDSEGAEIALKNGAWDYLRKPISKENIRLALKRVGQYRRETGKIKKDRRALRLDGIVGKSPGLAKCFNQVARCAQSDANVLILGETGTGKELFARAVHVNSPRNSRNFVVVDCAALPDSLVENLLFGHVSGAFTGAEKQREGLIKQADGGTLFLDEVGELGTAMQKRFLRVLETRRYRPLGGKKEISSNFRLVSATNKDLGRLVAQQKFRSDLLYRLKTLAIEIPPLCERGEDVELLAIHYIRRICQRQNVEIKKISNDFMETLNRYHWPGNIRELVNTLELAVLQAASDPTLRPKHLPYNVRLSNFQEQPKTDEPQKQETPAPALFKPFKQYRQMVLDDAESRYFKDLLAHTRGCVQSVCEISGLSRARVYSLIKKHGISRMGGTVLIDLSSNKRFFSCKTRQMS